MGLTGQLEQRKIASARPLVACVFTCMISSGDLKWNGKY